MPIIILVGLGNGWLKYLNSNWFRNPMPGACGTFAMTFALESPWGGYNASWSTLMLSARSSPGALVEVRKLMACLQGELRPKICLLVYLLKNLKNAIPAYTLQWNTNIIGSFWIDACRMVSWLRSLEPLTNCQSSRASRPSPCEQPGHHPHHMMLAHCTPISQRIHLRFAKHFRLPAPQLGQELVPLSRTVDLGKCHIPHITSIWHCNCIFYCRID